MNKRWWLMVSLSLAVIRFVFLVLILWLFVQMQTANTVAEQKLFSVNTEPKPEGFPAWQGLDFLVIFLKRDPGSPKVCRLVLSVLHILSV